MKARSVVSMLLLVGCRSHFAGTYHGENHQTAALSSADATGALSTTDLNDATAADVTVTESGDTVAVDYRGCHFEAHRTSATRASATAIDCPFPSSTGVTFHVDSAALNFVGNNLSWSWMGVSKNSTANGSFTSGFSGARK